jgi:WD40 repeat protein
MLFTETAFSQGPLSSTEVRGSVSTAPAAYVYVSSNVYASNPRIYAYAAASNGKLTAVAGSPFTAAIAYGGSLAVNTKYLFATNGVDISSFSVASNGGLRRVASSDAQGFNQSDCGGPVALFLDRSGATLYDEDIYSDCANNAYQFFGVGASTGDLSYLGTTARMTPEFEAPLSFVGNNKYAYGASCYHWNQVIFGFARNSDGALTSLDINPAMPEAQNGNFYCPYLSATDSADHVVVPVQPMSNASFEPSGAYQLATYTADSSGNLTTNSTYSNMPKVLVAGVTSVSMSPSGELLAVGGTAGLQVFHFNGANPVTHYTGLLTNLEVDQMSWDNDNHLYAISQSGGKLFVFTITPTSYSQAAGSPYTITKPQNVTVLAK